VQGFAPEPISLESDLECSHIGEVSAAVYGHASAEDDDHRLSGGEVYDELDNTRGTTEVRPLRLRAKLIRSLESYLARTAADLDERGEALVSRGTVLDQQREQLAEVEAMLAENRRRVGADRIDGKIEIELDTLFGLLADRYATPTEGGHDFRRTERHLALAATELSRLEQRVVEVLERLDATTRSQPDDLDRGREQSSSLLNELQVMLQERDHEVARLRGVVEAREGELAQTAATLAALQAKLQGLFEEFSARLVTGT
jgi:chromosome segregation ATPase